jgi:hypothetical protein
VMLAECERDASNFAPHSVSDRPNAPKNSPLGEETEHFRPENRPYRCVLRIMPRVFTIAASAFAG